MPRPRDTGDETGKANPRRVCRRRLVALAAGLLLAGCQQPGGLAVHDRDPLVGGQPPLPANTPPPPPAARVTSNPVPAPPPAFAPTSQTSPAALAAGTPANFDRSQELRIGNSTAAPAGDRFTAVPTALPPTTQGPGVTLRQPEIASTPRQDPAVTPAATLATVSSYEQLRAQLLARGVTDMRLETWGNRGAWKFTCSLPNPRDRAKIRTYEATAQDDLAAMRAVLDQMDRDR